MKSKCKQWWSTILLTSTKRTTSLTQIIEHKNKPKIYLLVGWFMVLNATFNTISVITWRSVLLVEETGVPGENHRPVASQWQTLLHAGFEITTVVVIDTYCTGTKYILSIQMEIHVMDWDMQTIVTGLKPVSVVRISNPDN